MKKGSNIREIARLAGVSVASVSRALQDDKAGMVSPELRRRILDVCEQHQYYPNVHTVRMFSKRAGNVAMIYPPHKRLCDRFSTGSVDPNLGACIAGAERELASRGVFLTLTSTTDKFLENKEYLRMYRSKMVDGFLVWGWTKRDSFLSELLAEGAPAVMIQCADGEGRAPCVVADDFSGMRQVVEHAFKLGHRRIALMRPFLFGSAGQERWRGMVETLAALGLEPCHVCSREGYGAEAGYEAGKELIAAGSGATCLVAPNDDAAFGVIQAAHEAGLQVPDDLSVAGADGLESFGRLQVTTYVSPSLRIGEQGAAALSRLLDGENLEPCERLPVEFIPGETTYDLGSGNVGLSIEK